MKAYFTAKGKTINISGRRATESNRMEELEGAVSVIRDQVEEPASFFLNDLRTRNQENSNDSMVSRAVFSTDELFMNPIQTSDTCKEVADPIGHHFPSTRKKISPITKEFQHKFLKEAQYVKRAEFVARWLNNNFKERENTSVARDMVYALYTAEARKYNEDPVNTATFGKVIRAVFPTVSNRRLGVRNNSKYHYFGIAPAVEGIDYVQPTQARRKPKRLSFAEKLKKQIEQQRQRGSMKPSSPSPKSNLPLSKNSATCSQVIMNYLNNNINYAPLIPDFEEFARFLRQICQPIPNRLEGIPLKLMEGFSELYQKHLVHLLELIAKRNFTMVETALRMFWVSLPNDVLPCLANEEGIRIASIADDYFYQVAIHILIPEVLEPLPLATTRSIRLFARSLDACTSRFFDITCSAPIVGRKLELTRRFCQVLRRRTATNHLSQVVRALLGTLEMRIGMLRDLSLLDFKGIKEQMAWIMTGHDEFTLFVEDSFRRHLVEGVPIEQWACWLENLVENTLSAELSMGVELNNSACGLVLRWSHFTSLLLRDLTLRSANSFGSFHLLRMFLDEYVAFYLERRLDEHRRALGLQSFWPQSCSNNEQESSSVTATYEKAIAAFASMDELFRKSAILTFDDITMLVDDTEQHLCQPNDIDANE